MKLKKLEIFNKMPKAYVYTLNLKGGNKYVGYTKNPDKRFEEHFSGNGAQWTQKHEPISVDTVQKVSSVAAAKKLETETYYKMKNIHGADKVRGAGNTSSISAVVSTEIIEIEDESDYEEYDEEEESDNDEDEEDEDEEDDDGSCY